MHHVCLGYACLNTKLRAQKPSIFASRTCRLDTLKAKGIEYVYGLISQNLQDLKKILEWNYNNNIFLYRMSSEMFPFATHLDYYKQYDLSQFTNEFTEIGELAKKYKQRLTYHPGQFTQISSHREDVVFKSIIEIEFHNKVMDLMNIDSNGVIIVHGGSKNGGKEKALKRFEENYKKLSENAQKRLVLENCEMCYSINDLLPISKRLNIPLVVDFHHYNINKGEILDDEELEDVILNQVIPVWNYKKIKPKFHLSESREGVLVSDSITKRRAHSDYISKIPQIVYNLAEKFEFDLMIEAKQKEDAVLKIKW
jgi:UV DNA damage endonuclease